MNVDKYHRASETGDGCRRLLLKRSRRCLLPPPLEQGCDVTVKPAGNGLMLYVGL
jgi:hypothetical protein